MEGKPEETNPFLALFEPSRTPQSVNLVASTKSKCKNTRPRKRKLPESDQKTLKFLGYPTPKKINGLQKYSRVDEFVPLCKAASIDEYSPKTPKRVLRAISMEEIEDSPPQNELSFSDINLEDNGTSRKKLDSACLRIGQKMAASDYHGIDGSLIIRNFQANGKNFKRVEIKKTLPYDCYINLETFTSESDNSGATSQEKNGLWLNICTFLENYVSSHMYPSIDITHHIMHLGLKQHKSQKVRSQSYHFLMKVIKSIYPPINQNSREYYIKLFSFPLQNGNNTADFHWNSFNELLHNFIKKPDERTEGEFMFFEVLVELLEKDLFQWIDGCILKTVDPVDEKMFPIIVRLLWNKGESIPNVNNRVKDLCQYYVDSFQVKSVVKPLLSRIMMVIAKVIETFEKCRGTNEIKEAFSENLLNELMKIQNEISSKKLWTELYLMEPQWLSMKLSKGVAYKMLPFNNNVGGLRNMIEDLTEKEIVLDSSFDEEDKENEMVIDEVGANTPTSAGKRRVAKKLKRNQYGETDLHVACRRNETKKVEAFIKNFPQYINEKDNNGFTALHEACFYGKVECVKLLLCNKADIYLTADDERKLNPLQDAVLNNKIEVVNTIFEQMYNAQKLGNLIDTLNNNDTPIINFATSKEMRELITQWEGKKQSKIIQVPDPERFFMMYSLAITKYVATFRIHAVIKAFKGLETCRSQDRLAGPMLELDNVYPYRPATDSKICDFPLKRTDETFVKDTRTYASVLSKNPFKNPGLEMLSEYFRKTL